MKPYLLPERFRLMRTGAALTGIPDIELREVIADAQAVVDAYCNVPLLPTPHSFRGGEALLEEHPWLYPTSHFDPGQRRLYPYHWPIREVTAFTLLVSAGATTSLPTDSLVINHGEKWVEVTSLAIGSNSGLFGVTGWIVPIGGLTNPLAQISYTYGNQYVETADRLYPIADTEARIFQSSYAFWTADDATIYVDGTEVTTGFTIDRELGRVTFAADQTGAVTADYTHEMGREISSATGHITAHLLGASKLSSRGMSGGVTSVKVGEISLRRDMPPKEAAAWLEQAVPSAALLLAGFRHWRMA